MSVGSKSMHRANIITAGINLLAGIVLVMVFSLQSRSGDWRQVSTSFGGITNLPSGRFAVVSVSNDGDRAVTLLDAFELEYVGIPPHSPVGGPGGANLTNLIRLVPTGTNLVVAGLRKADFLIPIPTAGEAWIARLEFAPAGLKTKLGEHLIRRQEKWATSLPPSVRGVPIHIVSQPFTRKGTANQTVE